MPSVIDEAVLLAYIVLFENELGHLIRAIMLSRLLPFVDDA